jgi:hypothetical protein
MLTYNLSLLEYHGMLYIVRVRSSLNVNTRKEQQAGHM